MNNLFNKKINKNNSGFILLEMLVAIGLFAVVMTMTLVAFLNILDIQAKTETFRRVNDNLNFSMEAMMREIREGYDYKCDADHVNDCEDGIKYNNISFFWREDNGEVKTITYSKNTNENNASYINRTIKVNDEESSTAITSEDVNIENLTFTVRGAVGTYENNDSGQPMVTIYIKAVAEYGKKEKLKSTLNLQTSVSQRKLDTGYEYE